MSNITVFPDFTNQYTVLAMILQFISKMDVSLPIFIFTVLPELVNSFRLFLFIRLWNDVAPLTRQSCIKQSLYQIPVCLIFSNCCGGLLSSARTPQLTLYNCWMSKSRLMDYKGSLIVILLKLRLSVSRNVMYEMGG